MKVILLNGPPYSGKDTIGKILAEALPRAVLRKFAYPIRQFMLNEFGVNMDEVDKDEPHPGLLGRTPRAVAIQYSEGFCKPLWGQDFFGNAARAGLQKCLPGSVPIFTDSGFAAEASVIAAECDCLQVLLKRPGKTFQGDSRGYWTLPTVGHVEFCNDEIGLDQLVKKVHDALVPQIKSWLNQ